MSYIFLVKDSAGSYLVHHGKPGQKWGERHGPPYPLSRQSESERKELKPGSKVLQGDDKRIKKNESYRQKQLKKLQKDVDYAQKKRDKITDKFNKKSEKILTTSSNTEKRDNKLDKLNKQYEKRLDKNYVLDRRGFIIKRSLDDYIKGTKKEIETVKNMTLDEIDEERKRVGNEIVKNLLTRIYAVHNGKVGIDAAKSVYRHNLASEKEQDSRRELNADTKFGGKDDSKVLTSQDYNKDREYTKKVADLGLTALKNMGEIKDTKGARDWFLYEDQTVGLTAVADLVNKGKSKSEIKKMLKDASNASYEQYMNDAKTFNLSEASNHPKIDEFIDSCIKVKKNDPSFNDAINKAADKVTNGVNKIADTAGKAVKDIKSGKGNEVLDKAADKVTNGVNKVADKTGEVAKDLIDSVKNLKNTKSGGREEILNDMAAKGFKESGNSDRFGKEYSLNVKTDSGRKAEIHMYEDELDSFDKTVDYKKLANNILPKAQKMVIDEFSKGVSRTMLDNMGISQNEFKKAVKSVDNKDLFFFYGPKGGMGVDINIGNLLGGHSITIDFDPKTMTLDKYVQMNG